MKKSRGGKMAAAKKRAAKRKGGKGPVAKRKAGHQVVVVVSAPGDMTDDLLELARGVSDAPDERELEP